MNAATKVSDSERLTSPAFPAWVLPALLVSGLIAGFAGEAIITRFQLFYFTPEPGMPPHPPAYLAQARWDNIRNHAIGFGGLGAILLGLSGLVIGLSRSALRAIVGVLTGLLLGGTLGAIMGAVGFDITMRLKSAPHMEGMLKAVLIFAPIWLILCLAAGLFGAVLSGNLSKIGRAVYLAVGWACGAIMLYLLVTVIVFPVGRPEAIVPEHTGVRLLAYVVGCVCVALAAGGIAIRSPFKRGKSQQEVTNAVDEANQK